MAEYKRKSIEVKIMTKFSLANRGSFSVLTEAQIELIHENALTLLSDCGVYFNNDEAREILMNVGCIVNDVSKIVKFPRNVIINAIESSPESFDLFDRDGKFYTEVGRKNKPLFFPGGNSPTILAPEGECRPATSKDLENLTRIADFLPQYDLSTDMFTPTDVPPELVDAVTVYTMLKNTRKPLSLGYQEIKTIFEFVSALRESEEDAINKPCTIIFSAAFTPLKWERDSCQSIIEAARYKMPLCIYASPVLGLASPVTVAGAILQDTVEVLSGITLAQAINPGNPVAYGCYASLFDMKSMNTPQAAIEAMMVSCGHGLIGKYYGLPICTFAGATESKQVDYQAGAESCMSIELASLYGFDLIIGAGAVGTFAEMSLEKVVMDAEAIGMSKFFSKGIKVDEETLARDLIAEVGHKGEYLQTDHTLGLYKENEYFPSEVIDRGSREQWESKGKADIVGRAESIIKDAVNQAGNVLTGEKLEALNEVFRTVVREKGIDFDDFLV